MGQAAASQLPTRTLTKDVVVAEAGSAAAAVRVVADVLLGIVSDFVLGSIQLGIRRRHRESWQCP